MADQPLYEFTSHIDGKNAKVAIWPDRIEWERKGVSAGKVAAGVWTLGISTIFTGIRGQDTDMVPIKQVTSVTSKKGMVGNTVVSVNTAGGQVDFRVSHKEAAIARETINRLILEGPPAPAVTTVPIAEAAPDIAGQIQQLSALHTAGILTDEEFSSKKADLLSRF